MTVGGACALLGLVALAGAAWPLGAVPLIAFLVWMLKKGGQ